MKYEKMCPCCFGHGCLPSEVWSEFFIKENELKEKYLSAGMSDTEASDKAWGEMEALQPDEPEELICTECEGKGMVPTEKGLEILQFIRKYLYL